ncbi:MAG: LemA family protein [Candidatus Dojkabacteria bacterium]
MGMLGILVVCLCIFALIAGAIALFVVGIYNGLRSLNVLADEGWSGIDVQLKKRFDLIPNLVETVKGYAKQEKDVFEKVAALRSGMMNAGSDPEKLGQMEGELRSTLKTLFAVAENYPELKSNENFMKLQSSLQEIETDIESARRYYNGTVRDLNLKITVFPNSVVAGFFRIMPRKFFEVANAEERENVKVQF